MKIYEYQAKALFQEFGIPVPQGGAPPTPREAGAIAARLGGRAVVKAQILAGGRGKAGGIKVASTPQEAEATAAGLLGHSLVTPQTGPQGIIVNLVLVEEPVEVEREFYLGLTIDRSSRSLVLIVSDAGGMDIEEVAGKNPERIHRATIDPLLGLPSFLSR